MEGMAHVVSSYASCLSLSEGKKVACLLLLALM